jgi:hypothetical protein
VPGSRLACAVRRRWPARAAEKGAGGVPAVLLHTRDAAKSTETRQRQSEQTPGQRGRAATHEFFQARRLPCRSSAALPTRST